MTLALAKASSMQLQHAAKLAKFEREPEQASVGQLSSITGDVFVRAWNEY